MLSPSIVLSDSGAHADSVYDYVLPRQHTRRRIFACKLRRLRGVRAARRNPEHREGAHRRMKIPEARPCYMHLPKWATDKYLEQLTGEKKITVRDRRTRTRKPLYVKTYTRNEALDLTVYCHAGLFILQHFIEPATYRDLGRLAKLVQQGHAPESLIPSRIRRVRSQGVT